MSTPPEWFQIAGPLGISTTLTAALFWQPRWALRLFARIAGVTDRLLRRLTQAPHPVTLSVSPDTRTAAADLLHARG